MEPARAAELVSIPAVPAPPWPKRKFSPTTTASADRGRHEHLGEAPARMRENAFVKGTTSSSSTPSAR